MSQEHTIALSLAATRESPFNPRKKFNPIKLQELAESIKSQGILQPVVARTIPSFSGWELVFGHRRFRAAKLAGLDAIPAFVRDMTDEEVKVAQIHENLEREDVSPLEEADGFHELMAEHGFTAEQLIEQTGKSKSYIYGRLKLRNLCAVAREACDEEDLPAELALFVARYPTESTQKKALDRLREKTYIDGKYQVIGWLSIRKAKQELQNANFTIPIADGRFDPEDTSLREDGRVCSACPLRSGNDADSQEAYGADVCTDTDCHEAKDAAHFTHIVDAHRAAGGEVLEGTAAVEAWRGAMHPQYYATTTHVALNATLKDKLTVRDAIAAMQDGKPPVTLSRLNPDGEPLELIQREHLAAVCEANGVPVPGVTSTQPADDDGAHGALPFDLTEEEEAARDKWGEILRAVLRQAKTRARTTDELRMVVSTLIQYSDEIPAAITETMGWDADLAEKQLYGEDIEWLQGRVATMTANELGVVAALFALCEQPEPHGRDLLPARVALARSYGVNPVDPETPLPTPSTAARAQGEASGKAESKAAPARGKKQAAKLASQLDLVEEQAGSAGKDEGAAGAAGGSDATSQANEPAEV